MGDLVDHAVTEISRTGLTQEEMASYVAVIRAFEDMGIAEADRPVAVQAVCDLLNMRTLTPVTDDPAEWMLLPGSADLSGGEGYGIWQNLRDPRMFSNDAGATHFHLSDVRAIMDAASARAVRASASSAVPAMPVAASPPVLSPPVDEQPVEGPPPEGGDTPAP